MTTEKLKRLKEKHRKKAAKRQTKSGRSRCEVIIWGDKGQHRCEQTAWFRKPTYVDGHVVCKHHRGATYPIAFTADDAKKNRKLRLRQ